MEKSSHLQRTCTVCGLTRPLSAFLYISSTRGTTYGTICSSCRGADLARRKNPPHETDDGEETGSTRKRQRIGLREKIWQEKEWLRQRDEDKQESKREREKTEKTEIAETEAKDEEKNEAKKRHERIDESKQPPPGPPRRPNEEDPLLTEADYVALGMQVPLDVPKNEPVRGPDARNREKLVNPLGETLRQSDPNMIMSIHHNFLNWLGGDAAEKVSSWAKDRKIRSSALFMKLGQPKNTGNPANENKPSPEEPGAGPKKTK